MHDIVDADLVQQAVQVGEPGPVDVNRPALAIEAVVRVRVQGRESLERVNRQRALENASPTERVRVRRRKTTPRSSSHVSMSFCSRHAQQACSILCALLTLQALADKNRRSVASCAAALSSERHNHSGRGWRSARHVVVHEEASGQCRNANTQPAAQRLHSVSMRLRHHHHEAGARYARRGDRSRRCCSD